MRVMRGIAGNSPPNVEKCQKDKYICMSGNVPAITRITRKDENP